MSKSEFLEFHEREAARLRRLLANVTTPALKVRLIDTKSDNGVPVKWPEHVVLTVMTAAAS